MEVSKKTLTWPTNNERIFKDSKRKTLPTSPFLFPATNTKSSTFSSQSMTMKSWNSILSSPKIASLQTLTTAATSDTDVFISQFIPDVPELIWIHILSYLDTITLCQIGLVCKTFKMLSTHDDIWRYQYIQSTNSVSSQDIMKEIISANGEERTSWKDRCVERIVTRRNWTKGQHKKRLISVIDPKNAITCFKFDADKLIVGTKQHNLLLFDTSFMSDMYRTSAMPKINFGAYHGSPILCSDLDSPAGFLLVAGDANGMLTAWNVFTGQLLAKRKKSHDKGISCILALSSNYIITAGFDRMIRLYKLEKNLVSQDSSNSINSIDLKPLRKKQSFWKRLFSKKAKTPLLSSKLTLIKEFRGHDGEIYCMKLICNGSMFASGGTDHLINIFDVKTGQRKRTLRGHTDTITCITSKSGELFSGSLDCTIRKWNPLNGQCLFVFNGHSHWIKSIDTSGDMLISGGWEECIFLWDIKCGTLLKKIKLDMGPISNIQANHNSIFTACREVGFQHQLIIIDFSAARETAVPRIHIDPSQATLRNSIASQKRSRIREIKSVSPNTNMDTTISDPTVCAVRVALRVRPSIVATTQQAPATPGKQPSTPGRDRPIIRNSIQIVPDEPQVIIGREESSQKTFTYDYVYGPTSNQEELYHELAQPLVAQFLEGFNATILAYGQTFSGKTYTMGSSNDQSTPPEERGIIPRAFYDVFRYLPQEKGLESVLKVSFLEVYQEQIRDLLMPQSTNREISVRENKGTIVVSGVHEQVVESVEDMNQCLISGGVERTTGDTLMHMHSSRSHAIFTITLELVQNFEDGRIPIVVRRSKLHLVDLAGSERLKRTGAEGVRLKESVKINSGLLALGNVISILGDDREGSDKQVHVPYRDSKLTRLLQDSLGGNSQTLMLACVSPLYDDTDETLNTLKYAYRARKIQNKPIVNVIDQLAMERTEMQQKIDQLEGKLKGLEDNGTGPVPFVPDMIDFDNDQWMAYFIEQLRNRTIKGTNAVKELEAANKENEVLKRRLEKAEAQLQAIEPSTELTSFISTLEDQVKIHMEKEASMQKMIDTMLPICVSVVKGEMPNGHELEPVKDVIKRLYPSGLMERASSKDSLATTSFPPILPSGRAPSTNSVARSQRRKRITSEDHGDESHSKSLEMELRETRKYLGQMEEELNRTRIRLKQTEAVSEQSSLEISKLMELNDSLRNSRVVEHVEHEGGQEIMSIKVLADAGVQTVHDNNDYPSAEEVFTSVSQADMNGSVTNQSQAEFIFERGDMSVEKMAEELTIATKVKVDLLKELSKVNKEAEKTRHAHSDHILRLERELESSQREVKKLIEEHQEKETLRDRARDDYERKIKHQESTVQKLKQKQKELEKSVKDKGSGDKRLQECHQEIEKLTALVSTLKKKVKDDHEKHQESDNRKSKEISVLNKQLDEESKKVRQLEVKAEMIRKKLDRKTEEVATISKKNREASLSNPSIKSRHSIAGSVADIGDLHSSNEIVAADVSKKVSLSSSKLELQSDLKSARDKVEDIEREMETTSDGERLHVLQKSKSEMVLQIAELRNEIRKKEYDDNLFAQFSSEWEQLLPGFESSFSTHQDETLSHVLQKLPNADLHQSRQYTIDCLKEVCNLQQQIASLNDICNQKTEEADEGKAQVAHLEKKIQKVIRAYEKKIANSIKEIQAKEVVNDAHSTAVSEVQTDPVVQENRMVDLPNTPIDAEKDVLYYRNVNKELKSKLREVVAVNHRLAKTLQKHSESNSALDNAVPVAVE